MSKDTDAELDIAINLPTLRIAIEQLVMHKRELWKLAGSEDYRPQGFVGLGSSIWLEIEVLAALVDLPAPTEGVDAFAVDSSTGKAAQLLEQGEHPWVCEECFTDQEKIGPGVLFGGQKCFHCGKPAVCRMRRHPHRWGGTLRPGP